MVKKRALRTLGLMHGLWDPFFFDQPVYGFNGLVGEAAQNPG